MTSEPIEEIPKAAGVAGIGLRGVFLGEPDRAYMNVVASPTASYLLPDLLPGIEQMSFGAVETREPPGILIIGDSVVVALSVAEDSPQPSRWSAKQMFDRLNTAVAAGAATPTADAPSIETPTPTGSPAPPPTIIVDEAHRAEEITPLPADAPMEAIASRVRELSGLSDARLADIFKVTRETFNRWRSGAMTNPTGDARRRVGMVLHLLEELAARGANIHDWLQNPSATDGMTPYDLLSRGRIDAVAYLAAAVGEQPLPARADMDERPLVFEDEDEGWESFDIEVADDED